MEWTGLNELRDKFLRFFESKGHLVMDSFPLVPQGDKSLLLINAGMAPLKKYFTGELVPPDKRAASCQKCIRTPDIDRVGITARHGTYFEMLGNFSFGDYFKKDAIAWAWEFCTEILEMPEEKLYISVYHEDDEAYDIWTRDIGIPHDHMARLGKEDNFWEHGAGPCGPCSEIHLDRGADKGCGSPDCKVGCDCDRYMEFWNLVFTQFENDGNNNYTKLKSPNIDTGMGLERLACIMQGVDNLFLVDTVRSILDGVCAAAGIKYGADAKKDISVRVITDHMRSSVMMAGDGIMPSNEGRGYVLRRLIRRAARHGKLLGISGPFLTDIAKIVINENENAYPALKEKQDFILKIIGLEEENFSKTIDTGLRLLTEMADKAKKILLGADAFKLSDTFGFPLDLTKEILGERGMTVDEEEFNRLIQKQKDTARKARKDAGADAWKDSGAALNDLNATVFTGYNELETDCAILAVMANGKKSDFLNSGEEAALILDKTPFYAESGGQTGDDGLISGGGFTFEVEDTTKTGNGVVLHIGRIIEGESLTAGEKAKASVDKGSRSAVMRNHTAAHLLQAALRKILGSHVEQAGQLVTKDSVRFDFTHFSALTSEEIMKVENEVNRDILEGVPVLTEEMGIDEAKAIGAMALFGEKYGDMVRVVRAGDFSAELCGGTHLDNTAKAGLFKILSETSVAAGVRRIEGVTGFGVLDLINSRNELIYKTVEKLKTGNISQLFERAAAVMAELKEKDREIESLKGEIAGSKAGEILQKAKDLNGFKVIIENMGETAPDTLRSLADTIKAAGDEYIAVLAGVTGGKVNFACCAGKKAVEAGVHAGNIVRETAKIAGGGGGGRPDSATAGGKDPSKLDEALDVALKIIEKTILNS